MISTMIGLEQAHSSDHAIVQLADQILESF